MQIPLGPSQIVLIKGGVLISGVVLYAQDTLRIAHSVCITVDVHISGVSTRRGSIVFTKF